MKILIYIQTTDNKINPISLESLVAAQQLKKQKGGKIIAITFSLEVSNQLTKYDIDEILFSNNQQLNNYSPLHFLEAFDQINSSYEPDLFIFGHTYETRDWVPRLSARLNIPFISDCIGMKLDNEVKFTRGLYQNKVNTDIKYTSESAIISFQSGTFKIDSLNSGDSEVTQLQLDLSSVKDKIISEEKFKGTEGGVDLSSADFIVSIGRGIGKEENIPIVREFSKLINAQLASSRPIVDSGWLDHSVQIGSSGQTVSPKLYFALGISGAMQHVVGMKGSDCVVVINKDSNAPIFELADYVVIGDIMEIIPKLNTAIKEVNG